MKARHCTISEGCSGVCVLGVVALLRHTAIKDPPSSSAGSEPGPPPLPGPIRGPGTVEATSVHWKASGAERVYESDQQVTASSSDHL
ncbi:unnamed protein product, partial [Boreogadus saida]